MSQENPSDIKNHVIVSIHPTARAAVEFYQAIPENEDLSFPQAIGKLISKGIQAEAKDLPEFDDMLNQYRDFMRELESFDSLGTESKNFEEPL